MLEATGKKMNQKQVVLYQTDDDTVVVSVYYVKETFWLNQKGMAELFGCSPDNVSLHLRNIYAEEELAEEATTEFFSVVQSEEGRQVRRKVLEDKGIVSREEAIKKAGHEYDLFRIRQDEEYVSDFDREMKRIMGDGDLFIHT